LSKKSDLETDDAFRHPVQGLLALVNAPDKPQGAVQVFLNIGPGRVAEFFRIAQGLEVELAYPEFGQAVLV
jgi:hypothetical protein